MLGSLCDLDLCVLFCSSVIFYLVVDLIVIFLAEVQFILKGILLSRA